MDGRSNLRNKAPFLNFSGVGWTGPEPLVDAYIIGFKISDHCILILGDVLWMLQLHGLARLAVRKRKLVDCSR